MDDKEVSAVTEDKAADVTDTDNKTTKKRFDWIKLVFILMFIVGMGFFFYPTVSDVYGKYRDSKLIAKYSKNVSGMKDADMHEAMEAAYEYNRVLKSKNTHTVYGEQYETDEEYEKLLKINGTGLMCYMDIPAIAVTLPIYHYSNDNVLSKGIGHIHGSSLPVGGDGCHSVLIGHRGLPSLKLFSDLDKIKEGDVFYIHLYDEVHAYRVYEVVTVLPTEVENLVMEDGRDLVTLVTCTPYGINTHRILVKGERVDYNGEETKADTVSVIMHTVDPKTWLGIGIMLFALIMFIVSKIINRKKKKTVSE